MKKLIVSTIAALAIFAGAASAEDSTEKFYSKDSGQWMVEGFHGSEATYCSATTLWNDGSFVSFYVTSEKSVNLMVHNKEWNIADPVGNYKGYQATFRFFSSNIDPDQGTADYTLNDPQTVIFPNINLEFLKSWTKYETMTIQMPGSIAKMDVGLSGTRNVTGYLGECITAMEKLSKTGQNL